ncbi:MAG TPA: DUF481 domain-containing protein [Candidatus Sulfopaludibacter sp.]|nr:DUF481 domain-containing protein [Candidatus Sulfopaludibacter sp.]
MKRHFLNVLVLAGLALVSRASETNQPTVVPADNPAVDSNNALTFLASESGNSQLPASAVAAANVATNKPAWESSVSIGVTATAGNVNSALATGNFRTHKKTPEDEWNLGADAAYGEVSSVKNSETLHGFGQYNHLFSERWYGYVRGDALHDAIADVVYRFTFSPGAGYYFFKDKETSLAGEAGPAILYEKLDDEYHDYPTLRLAERFEHKFDGHARLWQNVEFLPPFTDPRAFLVNAEVGVDTPLSKHLSLQTYVQDNYANRPAPGFEDNDVKLVSALAVKF